MRWWIIEPSVAMHRVAYGVLEGGGEQEGELMVVGYTIVHSESWRYD